MFSLDTLLVFVCIRRRYDRTGGPKNKLQTLVHIFTKYWWILQLSQGSVAMHAVTVWWYI